MERFDDVFNSIPNMTCNGFDHQTKLKIVAGIQHDLQLIRSRIAQRIEQHVQTDTQCCSTCGSSTGRIEHQNPVDDVLGSTSAEKFDQTSLEKFEAFFRCDLSTVRLHVGPDAAKAANHLGVSAFTVGEEIVFAEGMYRPGAHRGDCLIAHELTHVVILAWWVTV